MSFLREVAGPFEHDEAALLLALDTLAASRAGWQAECRRYDAVRRAEKRRGRRSPRPSEPNPYAGPDRWYGDARRAAVHALVLWQREHLPALLAALDPIASQVNACVVACLVTDGSLAPVNRQRLAAAVDTLRQRLDGNLYHSGYGAYDRTRRLLLAAHFVQIAADES